MALPENMNAAEGNIGAELAAKKQNVDEYKNATPPLKVSGTPEKSTATLPVDKVAPKARYGVRSGEQRIDTSGMTKPLGSFKYGTDSVPKTGPYKVHEGEAVIPKEKNALHEKMKASLGDSPSSAKPADLAAAQATPGTSTSTGGATAKRNSGAATGGAVTITTSGSSSTDTSTTTGAGAGKGAAKSKGGDKAGKEHPPVYNISVDSTGRSGDAMDGSKPGEDDAEPKSFKKGTSHVPKTGVYKLHEGEAVIPKDKNMADLNDKVMASLSGDDKKPKKEIKKMHIHKTANGKHIVVHEHHHPEHHPDEEHSMSDMAALHQHMEDHAGTPNEGEGAESAPPAGAAQMTAAPSPAPVPAAGGPAGM